MDERWFDVVTPDGVRLRARVATDGPGVTRDRRDLLLHHGLASSQRIWDLMLPSLVRRFRVVTFDARGHGLSGKPTSGYGAATTAEDAFAVLRAARLRRPIVAGHSWGAMVALELGVVRPRSVGGLFLIDGGVGSLRAEMTWPEVKRRLAPPHLAGTPLEEFRRMIPSFWGGAVEVTPEVEAIVLSLMRVGRDGTIRPRLSRANHFRILRAIWEQEPLALHARLRVPATALLALGPEAEDAAWNRAKRERAAAVRGSGARTRITWIEGIHDLPLQHPRAVARRLERSAGTAVR
jgi:pimeloyl-ACP methyl ester carboxylesterase